MTTLAQISTLTSSKRQHTLALLSFQPCLLGVEECFHCVLQSSCRGLLHKREFVSDYIGLDSTAADYLSSSTSVRLVGVDYLSVGMLEDIQETHKRLFRAVSLMKTFNIWDLQTLELCQLAVYSLFYSVSGEYRLRR